MDLTKNQPVYVIDGMPINNGITGASGRNNLEVDFGNGAGFVNPDDVESMTVLKVLLPLHFMAHVRPTA